MNLTPSEQHAAARCAPLQPHELEPTRRGLERATGLLPVDHPQLWTPRDLVRSAARRHAARVAGERWAQD
jgi:hypothetical protein